MKTMRRTRAGLGGRSCRPGVAGFAAALMLTLPAAPRTVEAQTLQGRVLDDRSHEPVATTLVRLVNEEGDARGVTVADSTGFYRLMAPQPGTYRLQAERLGYEGLETPLLEAEDATGTYGVDLLVRRSPIPIRGLEVTAEQVDERVRLMTGLSPRSLRWDPLRREDIVGHFERAHDVTTMVRWGNYAGIEVFEDPYDGPCYLMRRFGCLPVFLNGFPLDRRLVDGVPLEMLHTVVVLSPTESILYPAGGVLLYTEAWLR